MSYTDRDVRLLNLRSKQVRLSVSLLDTNYIEVENISGKVVSATYNMSSSSNIRRTCSIKLSVPSKEQVALDFQSTWIDRMVELKCGIYDNLEDEFVWYNLGRMLMKDGKTTYKGTAQEITLSLVDLMATLMEDRGSQMGTGMLFPVGSNVRDALIAVVATFSPFKRYDVCEFEDTIPYDLKVGIGQYPYDALKQILDLFPYYEMFYDVNGVFTVRKIPTKTDDPIDIPKEIINSILISEDSSVNFSDIKNTTEIWGRSLDAQHTALRCESDGECYNLYIDETFEALVVGDTYGFTPDVTSSYGQSIKIQSTQEYQIYKETGSGIYSLIEEGAMIAGVHYSVRYMDGKFVLQGELEIHVIVQEIDQEPSLSIKNQYKQENACRDVQWVVNTDNSPFSATIKSGRIYKEIRRVLEGGEYSNIYTTELAYERARYENWLTTRVQDTIELEMVLVPFMEANNKIQFTSPKSEQDGVYLVQDISYNFKTWTMTVKAIKFSPLYPWL